ncbi:MAG: SIMPL domain-containing protein [Microcystis wesenbergii Mw_QC_S_20081001_S30D]|uniref:SIMPL domain-containing protein n=1 Tax=Microcystis wesenbergii Mw_QC_S_20081001_S30D TaxID=2486245 RepID=A0A552JQW0_9CHRO|nr:SIMPL domain-containing protein [Microcystis aeruginosa W11-03]NCR94345.1 SIMPL domain-containing protein [Microcystis aeruginosa W11-06]TRU98045.1 MAG: SIMPL domain-containing protein [Microcystis wesenbergii Mw_QC_S_20081001_S30D]TRU98476.1 MAG: SIMPL domain-containing protein [Microcystis wesenbergii Mw_QC_S_20081001_S30]
MKDSSIFRRFPQVFAGLSVLSIALVLSSWIAARSLLEVKRASDVFVVTGSAKRAITSDYILWRLSVSSQQPTARDAYRDLIQQTERIRAYLKEKQVPDDAITTNAIETMPIPEVTNGQETGQILAYRLTQRFEIRAGDVARYKELSRQVTELIEEGINLVSEPPQYLYTQLDKLRVEMVAAATKDARARAEAIASSTGSRVGRVRDAKTGVFQITSRNSTDVSDWGIYDTSSIDKDITAVVSVTFGIE